jgi:hypothetical protein
LRSAGQPLHGPLLCTATLVRAGADETQAEALDTDLERSAVALQ